MGSFEEAIDQYNLALKDFVKGDPEPVAELFSNKEDVILCNPIHPFAAGPTELAETIREAASLFTDGTNETERVASFSTADLGYVVQVERWEGNVSGEHRAGSLRVTMVFRNEDGNWKVSHRHADPIERLGSL